jgi:hypothetical protein
MNFSKNLKRRTQADPGEIAKARGLRVLFWFFGEIFNAHPSTPPQLRGPSRLHGFECGHRGIHGQVQLEFFEGASVAPCPHKAKHPALPCPPISFDNAINV